MGKIYDISKQSYYFKNKNTIPINFIGFKGPMQILKNGNNIKNTNMPIEEIEEDQEQLKSNLKEITAGNLKYKSNDQLNTIEKRNIYKLREKVIKL